MDLLLSPATDDLDLTTGTLRLVEGKDGIAQSIKIRLRTFRGEWFLDRRIGVPYHEEIFSGRLRKNLVDSIFRSAILKTPGIVDVMSYVSTFVKSTRAYSVAFSAQTSDGETLDFSTPFIIDIEG